METPKPGNREHYCNRCSIGGQIVLAIDVFMTGEFHSPFKRAERKTDIPHFLNTTSTETALRVQDIVTAMTFSENRVTKSPKPVWREAEMPGFGRYWAAL
jgi:hypothetical protein